jgi:hypothetical protein
VGAGVTDTEGAAVTGTGGSDVAVTGKVDRFMSTGATGRAEASVPETVGAGITPGGRVTIGATTGRAEENLDTAGVATGRAEEAVVTAGGATGRAEEAVVTAGVATCTGRAEEAVVTAGGATGRAEVAVVTAGVAQGVTDATVGAAAAVCRSSGGASRHWSIPASSGSLKRRITISAFMSWAATVSWTMPGIEDLVASMPAAYSKRDEALVFAADVSLAASMTADRWEGPFTSNSPTTNFVSLMSTALSALSLSSLIWIEPRVAHT